MTNVVGTTKRPASTSSTNPSYIYLTKGLLSPSISAANSKFAAITLNAVNI